MRRPLLLLCASVLPACQCNPSQPTPVTLEVVNQTGSAIWVDDTTAELGLQVQQKTNGTFQGIQETLPCACMSCDKVCSGCSCPNDMPPSMVLRIDPGMSVQRVWAGAVENQATGNCGSFITGPTCFQKQIPPVNEVFNLHLEYTDSVMGIGPVDAGVPVAGGLPPGPHLTADKQFRIEDGVVQVGPVPGAACTTNADCTNPGELCFNGGCTTGCPANQIPAVGGGWQVAISTNDMGALSTTTDGMGRVITTGTGTVTSVQYSNGTMDLGLTAQLDGGGSAFAQIFVTLPTGYSVAIGTQQVISLKIVDASTSANVDDRAITIRDVTGNLILAADAAQLGPVLGAADISPFSVQSTQNLVGCDQDQCGKLLHFTTVFDGGPTPAELAGGQSQNEIVSGRTYQFLNVADDAYSTQTSCALQSLMPYAILYVP